MSINVRESRDSNQLSEINAILLSKPFAHRGLHSLEKLRPENSLTAFAAAVEAGYAIEIDVHLLKDGEVVIFHDEALERMTRRKGFIHDLSKTDLPNYKLSATSEHIPLFKEALDLVKGQVPLLIEIKQKGKVGALESAVANLLDTYKGPFAIQSFNPFTLQWFARNRPNILRGQLSGGFVNESINWVTKLLLRNLLLNIFSKPHFIGYDQRALPNKKVARLRSKNLPVLSWTIRSHEEQLNIKPFCDNVIFENYTP